MTGIHAFFGYIYIGRIFRGIELNDADHVKLYRLTSFTKDENPIDRVRFYEKGRPNVAQRIRKNQVSNNPFVIPRHIICKIANLCIKHDCIACIYTYIHTAGIANATRDVCGAARAHLH